MKKLLLILLIFLVGCGNDINKFKNEYEKEEGIEVNISKDSKVKYISAKETVDVLKNKTGILFFGIASDNTTRSVVETLLQVGKDNDLTIYYFDPNTVPDKDNDEDFAKILGILDSYLQSNEEDEKVLSVPDVYFIKDGKVMGNKFGSIISYDGEELNDDEKEQLYKDYNNLVKLIRS